MFICIDKIKFITYNSTDKTAVLSVEKEGDRYDEY